MNINKISPLKSKPLRYAGQSCDEEIDNILHDKALPIIMMLIFILIQSFLLWYIYFFNLPILYIAVISTIATIGFGIHAIIKIPKLIKMVNNYKLGRDGEKIVGQTLEEIRGKNARIFHDVIRNELNYSCNIDHIIVSIKGIYVIETKTFSKNSNLKKNTITFDGADIFINGVNSNQNYVGQISASVSWLENILKDRLEKLYPIKGVLIFPEWWVEMKAEAKKSDLWALNTKSLEFFLEKAPIQISHEDVKKISTEIKTYLKNHKR